LWSRSPDVLIATSLAFPCGHGRLVDGGYEVSGRWPLSSGVDNSDWNMLAFLVREHEDGPPVDQRFALVHRDEYEIVDTWHALGLAGTGSKDVALRPTFVPHYRTISAWDLTGRKHLGSTVNDGPLFRLSMLAVGSYVLSGVVLGCARGAYEIAVAGARKRSATTTGLPVGGNQAVQIKVAEAGARIDAATLMMRNACAQAMAAARAGHEPAIEDKVRYRRDAAFAVRLSLEAVDIMMGVAGSSGIYLDGAMQRLFRDAHAANAHVAFSPDANGALFGQHALGVAPPSILI
jgi:3-hydroxy-9,10-secoandrosta-1,3,5(10)-triene-9,17-dione monooxygenase